MSNGKFVSVVYVSGAYFIQHIFIGEYLLFHYRPYHAKTFFGSGSPSGKVLLRPSNPILNLSSGKKKESVFVEESIAFHEVWFSKKKSGSRLVFLWHTRYDATTKTNVFPPAYTYLPCIYKYTYLGRNVMKGQ